MIASSLAVSFKAFSFSLTIDLDLRPILCPALVALDDSQCIQDFFDTFAPDFEIFVDFLDKSPVYPYYLQT